MKKSFSDVEKSNVVTAIIVVLGLIIGYNVVYRFSLDTKAALEKKLKEEIERVVLVSEADILNARVNASEKLLSESKSDQILASEISNVAGKSGLKIMKVEPLQKETTGTYERLAVSVLVEGSFSQIGRFIDGIEKSNLLISVDKFNLESNSKALLPKIGMMSVSGLNMDVESIVGQVELVLSTYYKR